jgi:regulator of protease activity HflC (stomatin/prohibitin superfamily)
MAWIWVSVFFIIIGIVLIIASFFARNGQGWYFGSGIAVIVLTAIIFFIGGFREVPVKTVGVMTSFGRVEGDLTPGVHHTWPWKDVALLPETIQTVTWTGGFNAAGTQCVPTALSVRIGGQQTACLDGTIQYQIRDSAAGTLFNLYDTSSSSASASMACPSSGGNILGDICNAVVVREFEVAVNQALGDYNPIEDTTLTTGKNVPSQFSSFGPLVQAQMNRDIGSEIVIHSVLIPFAHYDASTQGRLNAIAQQYGATAIAQQEIATNQALARANHAIGNVTTGQLIAQCLGIVQDAEKTGYELPAGFGNCITGSPAIAVSGK